MPGYVYRGNQKLEDESKYVPRKQPKNITSKKIAEIVNNKTRQALIKHYAGEYNYICTIIINEFFGNAYDNNDHHQKSQLRSMAIIALRRRHEDAYEHLKIQVRKAVYAAYNYNPERVGTRPSQHEDFIRKLVALDIPDNYKGADLS